jgi:hypothetical protein
LTEGSALRQRVDRRVVDGDDTNAVDIFEPDQLAFALSHFRYSKKIHQ